MKRTIIRALLLLWGLALAALLIRVGLHLAAFQKVYGALSRNTAALAANTEQAAVLEKDLRDRTEEAAFFKDLLALYPENKGYLRSQKAIEEEVSALRRTAGARLAGKLYIAVDTKANKLYLKKGLRLLWQTDCSVGKGGTIKDRKTGRNWLFATPRGEFRVITKIDNPAWIKPDWAFVESKEPIPPPGDPLRLVEGELGKYALNIGDGYLIHGTRNEESLGSPVSHGCIRLGAEALEKLYKAAPVGTKVYIY